MLNRCCTYCILLQWIIRHTLFGGLLTGATVVVVTKHPSVIQAAQLVVAMQHGRAVFTGSPGAYANWRAKQTATAHAAAGGGGANNGWTPLVRWGKGAGLALHLVLESLGNCCFCRQTKTCL
jgi:hypothetical protein